MQAQIQAREYRLLQLNAMMRAEIDHLAGRPSCFATTPTRMQRWLSSVVTAWRDFKAIEFSRLITFGFD